MECYFLRQCLLFLLLLCQTRAVEFTRLCSTVVSEVVPVVFDKESGTYVIVDRDDRNTFNRSLATKWTHEVVPALSVSRTPPRRVQQQDQDVVFVRECACSFRMTNKTYCPIDKTTCGIPRDASLPVACFSQSSRTSLIRNAWPVIVLWYGGLAVFLLFTQQGANARHFCWRKCCNSNFNENLIDYYWYVEDGFWRRRRPRRRFSLFPFVNRPQRREEEQQQAPPAQEEAQQEDHPPNQLALATKRFSLPSVPTEDEDDVACAICFSPLEEGDRVGALECNHNFHVECLKTWLPRRNVCPLCQAPDVAAPQYQPQQPRGRTLHEFGEGRRTLREDQERFQRLERMRREERYGLVELPSTDDDGDDDDDDLESSYQEDQPVDLQLNNDEGDEEEPPVNERMQHNDSPVYHSTREDALLQRRTF